MTLPPFGIDLPALLTDAAIAGLSMAVVRDGRIVGTTTQGVKNTRTGEAIGPDTVFDAASLSKPVFAYAVLQLVDAGILSLDERLSRHLPDYVPGDPRAAAITARHVLSHTTGLPNWRRATHPMKTYFAPGDRFSYSGEGFSYLQKIVETLTGEPLDAVMRRLVFQPLGMPNSSYVWQPHFEPDHAEPHDQALRPGIKPRPAEAGAAFSLQTTAPDYARFLQAAIDGAGLSKTAAALWHEPQIRLRHRCIECLQPGPPGLDADLAWGLGWGLEPGAGTFFHWGHNNGFRAFTIGSAADRSALVVFTNSATGLSIMPDIVQAVMPGDHPVFGWLGYEHHASPRRLLLRTALSEGIAAAWEVRDGAALDEGERRATAGDLLDRRCYAQALWLQERNAADFADSAGCHVDLGRGYAIAGRLDKASVAFQRAATLDPTHEDAVLFGRLLAEAAPSPSSDGPVALRLAGFPGAGQVLIAGDFAGSGISRLPVALPMTRTGDGWSIRLDLPPGSYDYGFIVDGVFHPDPDNPTHRNPADPDSCSVLTIGSPEPP